MRPVQIGTVETVQRTDPDTNRTTRTELIVYPTKRLVELDQTSEAKSERQAEERHYDVILATTLATRPDVDAASTFLASHPGQSLLACICDGHEMSGVGC